MVVSGIETGVTGQTAVWKDTGDQMKSWLAPVVAFVLLFAFALLLVAFRSLVIAVKAIVLNLLSVAAAYGVLVLVFQHGVGKGLLGFSETSGIEPFVPLLLFVILFGLSMDYHVFTEPDPGDVRPGREHGRCGRARDQVDRRCRHQRRRRHGRRLSVFERCRCWGSSSSVSASRRRS